MPEDESLRQAQEEARKLEQMRMIAPSGVYVSEGTQRTMDEQNSNAVLGGA